LASGPWLVVVFPLAMVAAVLPCGSLARPGP